MSLRPMQGGATQDSMKMERERTAALNRKGTVGTSDNGWDVVTFKTLTDHCEQHRKDVWSQRWVLPDPMILEMRVNKFWLIMRTDQLFLMLLDLFSSQNQNVPYKKFLRKLGFLAAPGSHESLTRARVARSGFLPGGGWLWSKHPGAAAHSGAQRSAGEKATAWDCLDTPHEPLPRTSSREVTFLSI